MELQKVGHNLMTEPPAYYLYMVSPKVDSGFSILCYGQTQINFSANPIYLYISQMRKAKDVDSKPAPVTESVTST